MAETPIVELLLVGTGIMFQPPTVARNRRLKLQRRTLVLGRDPTRVDVCLAEVPAISRVHCTIHFDEAEEKYYLIDNDSAYGVFVNGNRLESGEWYPLTNGSEIELSGARVGGTLLRFYTIQEDAPTDIAATQPSPSNQVSNTTILRRPETLQGFMQQKPPANPAPTPAPIIEKRIFLSYCRQDRVLMQFVTSHLRSQSILQSIEIWTDEKLTVAEEWSDQLEQMLDRSAALLVLVSPYTKASDWVRNEIRYASDKNKRIFPLVVNGVPREVMPLELIRAQYIDLNPNPLVSLEQLTQAIALHFGLG